jgi:hypothetical protein
LRGFRRLNVVFDEIFGNLRDVIAPWLNPENGRTRRRRHRISDENASRRITTTMTNAITTRFYRALGGRLHRLRTGLAQLDVEATSIRLVAVGLVLGLASLLILEPAAHRNTDTTTERVARIAPVGDVRVAANAAQATGALGTPAPAAGNGS